MMLAPYTYDLLPALAETGSSRFLAGNYELAGFEKGARSITLKDGINFELDFVNAGDVILITGTVAVEAATECDRCLEPAAISLQGELDSYAVFDTKKLDEDAEADEYLLAGGKQGSVDVAPLLFSALVLALPSTIICDEDCKGLCPTCGANLNTENCSCEQALADANHPFAALKDLFEGQ